MAAPHPEQGGKRKIGDGRLTKKGISPATRVLGVMGYPVAHSLSPAMFNAAFAHLGMDWIYLAFAVRPERLTDALNGIRSLGLVGVNVTVPLKEMAKEFVEQLTPEAQAIGAVNCICCREEVLLGHNTDGSGFLTSLREDGGFEPRGRRVLLLGAGGAARAIAITLGQQGIARLDIANRTRERAERLAEEVSRKTGASARGLGLNDPALERLTAEAELIVQASSVGMHYEDRVPDWFNPDWLAAGTLFADIIYRPRPTVWLREAAARGCRVIDGLGMLVRQGAQAFSWWTGVKAPLEVMRAAALEQLGDE